MVRPLPVGTDGGELPPVQPGQFPVSCLVTKQPCPLFLLTFNHVHIATGHGHVVAAAGGAQRA